MQGGEQSAHRPHSLLLQDPCCCKDIMDLQVSMTVSAGSQC